MIFTKTTLDRIKKSYEIKYVNNFNDSTVVGFGDRDTTIAVMSNILTQTYEGIFETVNIEIRIDEHVCELIEYLPDEED